MGTKSITITNEAYERLAALKCHRESFSDVVNKLARKHSLLELVGTLSSKEAREIKDSIKHLNNTLRKQTELVAERTK